MRSFIAFFIWRPFRFLNLLRSCLLLNYHSLLCSIVWVFVVLIPNLWGFCDWLCLGFLKGFVVGKLWILQFRLRLLRLRLLHFVVHVSLLLLRTANFPCKLILVYLCPWLGSGFGVFVCILCVFIYLFCEIWSCFTLGLTCYIVLKWLFAVEVCSYLSSMVMWASIMVLVAP